ncbi:hypothetical protein SAMN02745165_03548 [Malonomonas rubra DSM 5091]|uniref:Uncharacterized protein n=1 Tax=Malonomonas rubra DSM 5091 TaxID=1122189 RepID=A0A1M6NA68_MALRU|nr:hypothetical protein [Malonomonas rubra]SHJ92544.1 hypothetical protein SAMN02745165_03548 [Malonomonas rubra DSM 5091]
MGHFRGYCEFHNESPWKIQGHFHFQILEKMQIVGRFLSRKFEFKGLRSIEDVASCLYAYDESACYPENSEWTYTRYFAVDAFDNGWRLYKQAPTIWKSFSYLRSLEQLPTKNEIPMEYFARTVDFLLTEKLQTINDFEGFSLKDINEAIIESGYIEGSRYLDRPNEEKNK